MNRLANPWRSTTTRIVFSYGLFFVAWALVLVLFVYWETASRLSEEADHQLKERAEYLAAMDPVVVGQRLQAMYDFDLLHINAYGLFDATGRPLAGHLISLPPGLRVDGEGHLYHWSGNEAHTGSTRILAIRLRDGTLLVLARDAGLIDELRDLIVRAMLLGLSLTLVPGIAGGVLLSVRPLRRIRELQAASDRVISGELDQRLPVSTRGDELDMLSGIVNRMLAEIERLMLEVRSVCQNIAHDLRTPLTHLRGHLHQLQQQTAAEDGRLELIERALAENDELLARFSALLRVSELRDEQRRVGFGPVDLGEVLEQVASLYEPLAEEKSIRLSLETRAPIRVRGDRHLLIECFSNLVSNGVRFTPQGGAVTIRSVQESQGARVDVIDTGPGISPAERRAVFERFYRSDRSRSTPGFGLGLSIVAAIVHLHGFQVEAGESEGGACLTVRCWAPAVLDASGAPAAPPVGAA